MPRTSDKVVMQESDVPFTHKVMKVLFYIFGGLITLLAAIIAGGITCTMSYFAAIELKIMEPQMYVNPTLLYWSIACGVVVGGIVFTTIYAKRYLGDKNRLLQCS
ncbi:hypothetical protein [Rubinisphaera italica]|nr:hypothetical protein [Rubinisphaera italica]